MALTVIHVHNAKSLTNYVFFQTEDTCIHMYAITVLNNLIGKFPFF